MEIVLIILILIIVILAAVLIVLKMTRGGGGRSVVIRGGVDVDTQKNGSDSGSLFEGTYDDGRTYVITGDSKQIYRIHLQNLRTGERHLLQFRECAGIGRAAQVKGMESFLTISGDMRISGCHCRLFASNRQIYIEDAGSKNHTSVNEKRVTTPVPLRMGDVIRIGDTRLRVGF